jgi:hypothetical protein
MVRNILSNAAPEALPSLFISAADIMPPMFMPDMPPPLELGLTPQLLSQPVMVWICEQVFDVTGELYVGGAEQDEVIADLVELGHRLVQQQQIGSLGEGERESGLGALPARQAADAPVQADAQPAEPPHAAGLVPPGIEAGAHAQRVGHREGAV